ncbi:Os10g0501200 [Oryza sativa Japonica Group]|uniref:Os10g0501200 protein n=1 Tax=Oryza sativa subsp. japonica TaxID=39947 RepID=Q0IWL7_ORYSJ|nr:Os10g0501200 [Oryza sativa Japonica Group]|eukprot:NP_001064984.2 Os10g0501200 [Oryza sativa Japonica Group]
MLLHRRGLLLRGGGGLLRRLSVAVEESVSPSPPPPPPRQPQEDSVDDEETASPSPGKPQEGSVAAEERASPSPPPPRRKKDSLFRRVAAAADPRLPLSPVLEQWCLAEERPIAKPEIQSIIKYLCRRRRFSQALQVRDERRIYESPCSPLPSPHHSILFCFLFSCSFPCG